MTEIQTAGLTYLLFRMIRSLAVSLLLTLALEMGLALILGVRRKHDFYIVLLVNILTNPVVVYFVNVAVMLAGAGTKAYWCAVVLLEFSAVAVEGYIYSIRLEYQKLNPWLLSLLLNAFSYGMGLVIGFFM